MLQVGIKISKEETASFFRHKKMQYLKMGTLHFCEKAICYSAADGLIRGKMSKYCLIFFFNFSVCRIGEKEKRLRTSFNMIL